MGALILFDTQTVWLQPFRYVVDSLLYPVRSIVGTVDDAVRRINSNLSSKRAQAREINELNGEVLRLRWELFRAHETARENQRLRELLVLAEDNERVEILGAALALPPDPLKPGVLVLNRGTVQGVKEGQTVLDSWGVIGKVIGVTLFDCRVLVINDPAHSLVAEVRRTGERILVHGAGARKLEAALVPLDSDLREGDVLVTSGLSGYQQGYLVGEISGVEQEKRTPYLRVEAESSARADLSRHFVLVVEKDSP